MSWHLKPHRINLLGIVLIAIGAAIASNPAWPDVEDARLVQARARIPEIATRYAGLAERLGAEIATASRNARVQATASAAAQLWQRARSDVQLGAADDRALYWGRLALRATVADNSSADEREQLLAIIELHTRGHADAAFPDHATTRVLITGFDPFHLDQDIDQSNPSGLAALKLDGTTLQAGDRSAHIEAATFPVRFDAFDNGMVEDFFTTHYLHDELSLVVTVSMGRDEFDLERFPGRRRSAESPDNANVLTGASANGPLVPMLRGQPLAGPEFVEFSLPAAAMVKASGDWTIRDNRNVQTVESGALEASSLSRLLGETAVRGSGGGYLSNEISYRSIRLRNELGLTIPIGHIHTPSVRGYQETDERRIVAQISRMLEQAIGVL
ncbi:MAG: hypothetical protein OES38_12780 [Gammaproteobacteria bacterium]|nr:hypothetical protein [Gammaproteobacteria bacterium]